MGKILLIFIAFTISVQKSRAVVFQVLVVTDGVKIDSKKVLPLEKLSSKVTLTVPEGGYVALIDDLTNLYEFYGQRTILLDTLNGTATHEGRAPNVIQIYSDSILFQPIWNESTDSIFIVLPHPYAMGWNVLPNREYCFEWVSKAARSSKKRGYEVVLLSEFNEILSKFTTNDSNYCFKPAMAEWKKKTAIFCEIRAIGNASFKSGLKRLRIVSSSYNDVSLAKDSPFVNLLAGIFCEERGFIELAAEFFENAIKLAPSIKEYESILLRFEERH